MNHWLILPILVPALVAPLIALAMRYDVVLARVFSVFSSFVLVVLAIILLVMANEGTIYTYILGNWAAPFGIVLVLDRLSAMMVLLAAVIGFLVVLFVIARSDKGGRHFHSLFQFQLMGINGAFLTGDFFNLFVFFEVLLIASYGLMVHGGGAARIRAGVQYVTVNLVGSSLFLIAVGLIYSVTGTLNMADLALKVSTVPPADQALLHVGALLLLLVFSIKAALVPVQFWLPGTYANAPAPVAALFSILTKVGAYAIIRLYTLAFGALGGEFAWLAEPWLLPAALMTIVIGMTGVLAARSLGQQISFATVGSMGAVLAAVGLFTEEAMAAALYYIPHSTASVAALFLIIGLIVERRGQYGDQLIPAPRFAQIGLLAGLFFLAAISFTGMPPLSGFIGKLLILDSAREGGRAAWLWGVLLGSSLLAIVGFARSGSVVFWKSGEIEGLIKSKRSPTASLRIVAVCLMLSCSVFLTAFAGPLHQYMQAAAQQLFSPQHYIGAVLGVDWSE